MRLLQERPAWWRGVLDFRYEDEKGGRYPLLLAVRHSYLSIYVEGLAILELRLDRKRAPHGFKVRTHRKYVRTDAEKDHLDFEASEMGETPKAVMQTLSEWVRNARGNARTKGSSLEKQGVATVVMHNSHVIDVEMALPSPATDRKVADRIDIVALERSGSAINIVFYEAKVIQQ